MGKGLERRKIIFDKFSQHLTNLINGGLLTGITLSNQNSYVCPVCLNQFSINDISADSKNMLTLEDSPPDSLGGKKVALTCKSCNSICGHDIDFHLQERLLELDAKLFLPNSKQQAKTTIDGVTVNSEIRFNDKKIEVVFSNNNNDPKKTKEYLDKIAPNGIVTVKPNASRVDVDRFQIALLKSAYILAFAKLGYNLILDSCYDVVREQLKNPDKMIYPEGFWTEQPFEETHEGVHFILDKGYESILVIFPLKTKSKVRRFGVVLPLPNVPIKKVADKLKQQQAGFGLNLYPTGGNDNDYLFNSDNISAINGLIKKITPHNNGS